MNVKPERRSRSFLNVALGTILVVFVLSVAKPVLLPLALAVLLTFILSPVASGLQRLGLKRVYAVLLTAAFAAVVAVGAGWGVTAQIQGLIAEIPRHKDAIRAKVDRLRGSGGGPFRELLEMVQELTERRAVTSNDTTPESAIADNTPHDPDAAQVVVVQPGDSRLMRWVESVLPVLQPLATAGLVVILVVFMLANREDLRDRLLGLAGHAQLSASSRVMGDAAERVGRYLFALVAVNVGFGLAFSLGLWAIGVQFAYLWGFLAALFRFVPFLGTGLAASFPILWSVALSPGWGQPMAVLCFFGVLSVTTSQVIEPLLFGRGTGVAPIALLVAASFWAWLWGPVGLLLATPMTVCLVVLGQHVPRLSFLALLLGNTPALPPPARLYQRLFARDEREAEDRVREFAAEQGWSASCDDMILPALRTMRRDRRIGALSADGEEFALAALQRIIERTAPVAEEDAPGFFRTIVAVPAHHAAEECTIHMLSRLLYAERLRVESLTTRALPSDLVDRIGELAPAAVLISVLPPGGLPQAAFLCRQLRRSFPALKIVVGWWGRETEFDRLLVKLRKAGASYVTTSLQQTVSQLKFVTENPSTAGSALPQFAGVHRVS